MAKKQQGGATIERGTLPGEAADDRFPAIQPREAEVRETPIVTLSELVVMAAVVTPADTERLKASGHHFQGGWPGSSLTVNVKLSPEASNTFRAAYIALNRSNARLSDGKHVGSIADTLRWFMERLTEEVGERAGA